MRVKEIEHEIPVRASRSSDSELILSVENLSLSYGERNVFSNLSFTGSTGELIVLDSSQSPGSGKSSLLRMLAGVQNGTSGQIKIHGESLDSFDRSERAILRRDSLSFLGQREASVEHLTLNDFLDRTSVDLGAALNTRKKSPMSTFSGGERARIELTKIIAEARPILLLDEPTSQMDEKKVAEVIGLLYEYLSNGGLAVVSTRNEYLIAAADQVLELLR